MNDTQHMKSALTLARQGLGRVAPNPAVGCIIVKDGVVIARARTGDGGRPHAEEAALDGIDAREGTAYITLEPCAHRSCAKKLVAAGITRAVIACRDPDKRTSGKGIEILKAGGVEVIQGVCEKKAMDLNKGFFLTKTQNRPLVTLKTATSLDGKIALSNGRSKWITGTNARVRAHKERARHDAIMVGIGTVLADNPSLTTRANGISHSALRVVLDTDLRTPISANVVGKGLVIFHGSQDSKKKSALESLGVRLFPTTDIKGILKTLCDIGVTRLLVEGGAGVVTSFLKAGLFDRFLWFRAPIIIGGDGRCAIDAIGLSSINNAPRLALEAHEIIGKDLLEIYRPIQENFE